MHRDVTSGNVLLTEGAHARIADFGLAQQLVTVDSMIIAAPVEAESILMGTYGYVAPEYATAGAHKIPLSLCHPLCLACAVLNRCECHDMHSFNCWQIAY